MLKTAVLRSIVCVGLIYWLAPSASSAQVAFTELTQTLGGKNITPRVQIGYSATTRDAIVHNGRPAEFPVKTQIYPDGHEYFRIEWGIVRGDAGTYRPFKDGTTFRIAKVEAKSECLELELLPLGSDGQVNTQTPRKGYAKIMLGKEWQTRMSSSDVLQLIDKYLPDEKDYIALVKSSPLKLSGNPIPTLKGRTVYPAFSYVLAVANENTLFGSGDPHPAENVIMGPRYSCEASVRGAWNTKYPLKRGTALIIDNVQEDLTGVRLDLKTQDGTRSSVSFWFNTDWEKELGKEKAFSLITNCLTDSSGYEKYLKAVEEQEAAAKIAAEKAAADAKKRAAWAEQEKEKARVAESLRIQNLKRDVTLLSGWTVDKSRTPLPGVTPPIRALAKITGIEGATADVSMSCRPDEDTTDVAKTQIITKINIHNAAIDKNKTSNGYKAVYTLYTIQDDTAWSSELQDDLRGASYCAYTVHGDCIDWRNQKNEPDTSTMSYWIYAPLLDTTRKTYSVIVSIDHGLVEFRTSRTQPVFDAFLKNCNKLTPKQERLKRSGTGAR